MSDLAARPLMMPTTFYFFFFSRKQYFVCVGFYLRSVNKPRDNQPSLLTTLGFRHPT